MPGQSMSGADASALGIQPSGMAARSIIAATAMISAADLRAVRMGPLSRETRRKVNLPTIWDIFPVKRGAAPVILRQAQDEGSLKLIRTLSLSSFGKLRMRGIKGH
jgi:hypothetical protein